MFKCSEATKIRKIDIWFFKLFKHVIKSQKLDKHAMEQ